MRRMTVLTENHPTRTYRIKVLQKSLKKRNQVKRGNTICTGGESFEGGFLLRKNEQETRPSVLSKNSLRSLSSVSHGRLRCFHKINGNPKGKQAKEKKKNSGFFARRAKNL